MQAEIISIGTELLLGEIVDSNAAYIARQLASIGLNLFYKATVGDNAERIAYVIRQAMARADVIITTGGVGPTIDDVTREGVALATDRTLYTDQEALRQVEAIFERWGRSTLSENNRRQALMPTGATVIPNPVGTAPSFIVEHDGHIIISLPGVPREMEHLMQTAVLPFLRERLQTGEVVIKSKVLRTCAIGESTIDERIGDLMTAPNPTVGLAAHAGQTDIRITAKAHSQAEADRLIADMEARVRARVDPYIYGIGRETLEEVVARLLTERQGHVSVIETNTAGDIARRLSQAPNGDHALQANMVVGENLSDLQALGLDVADNGHIFTIEEAAAAAAAWRAQTGAEYVLAVLGSANEKEDFYAERTGYTRVAVASAQGIVSRDLNIGGRSDHARAWVGNHALDVLRRVLLGLPSA
jgi:nicotinamide-nucleotide amidase